jgi:hypothetical protein
MASIAPTWNENVRPISFVTNQSGAYRILANVSKLFGQTFVMPKAMIDEISLPSYARHSGGDPLIIPDQLRKRVAAIDADQAVQMVWHKQQKIQIPSPALVIDARRVEQHLCAAFVAKLILSASLATNGDEINRAEASGEMGRVIELLAQHA